MLYMWCVLLFYKQKHSSNVTLENRAVTPGRVCAKMLGITGLPPDGWLRCKLLKWPGSQAFNVFLMSSKNPTTRQFIHSPSPLVKLKFFSALSWKTFGENLKMHWRFWNNVTPVVLWLKRKGRTSAAVLCTWLWFWNAAVSTRSASACWSSLIALIWMSRFFFKWQ